MAAGYLWLAESRRTRVKGYRVGFEPAPALRSSALNSTTRHGCATVPFRYVRARETARLTDRAPRREWNNAGLPLQATNPARARYFFSFANALAMALTG